MYLKSKAEAVLNCPLTYSTQRTLGFVLRGILLAFPLYTFSVWTYLFFKYPKSDPYFKTHKLQEYIWGVDSNTALLINELCLGMLIVFLVQKAMHSKKKLFNAVLLTVVLVLFCINTLWLM